LLEDDVEEEAGELVGAGADKVRELEPQPS
jgi:hypothetical protein